MKVRVNEKGEGIGVLGIIMLIILIAVLAVAGYFAYEHFHSSSSNIVKDNVSTTTTAPASQTASDTNTSSTNKSQTTTSNPTTSTAKESSTGTSVVKIPPLSVQLTVPNSIDDLIYLHAATKTTPAAATATFSTTTLANLDPACGVDATKTTATIQGIGELYEYSGTYTASTNPDKTSVWSKQFPSFYVAYNTPASDCSKTASVNSTAQLQITALKNALSSMTVLTQ